MISSSRVVSVLVTSRGRTFEIRIRTSRARTKKDASTSAAVIKTVTARLNPVISMIRFSRPPNSAAPSMKVVEVLPLIRFKMSLMVFKNFTATRPDAGALPRNDDRLDERLCQFENSYFTIPGK